MHRRTRLLALAAIVGVSLTGVAFYADSHGGRTDKNGGHRNTKTGKYHYHSKKSSAAKKPPPARRAPARRPAPATRQPTSAATRPTPPAGNATSARSYPTLFLSGADVGQVLRVVDGDTVEVQYMGQPTTVRLIGVDAPDAVHEDNAAESYATEATAFLANLLSDESVMLLFDGKRRDEDGRLLAYLFRRPDRLFVNMEIVRQGYGRAGTASPHKYAGYFTHYELRAKSAEKGLWALQDGASNTDAPDGTATIATFNIQIFGKSKRSKPEVMEVLADIADEFDILAVQEIRDASGDTPGVYLDAMNAQGDEHHRMVVGPRLGRSSSKEEYAFYYDADVVDIVGEPWTYPDPGDRFEREPFLARFRVGALDFVLVNIHVKPDDAVAEIDALDDVAEWARAQFGDTDIIVLGDLNADCSYFKEDTQRDLLDMNWITPVGFDTTVKDTDCTYDHFVISDSLLDEYTGEVGVYRFDVEYGLTQEFSTKVSDHYPLFATFSVGR